MNETIYLETTAVIDAAFKSYPEVLQYLKSSHKRITSHYVKMEIKKGFLYHLVLLHNKIIECSSWSEVQQFVANLASSPRRYYLGATLDALKKFWTEIENNRPSDLKEKFGNFPLHVILRRESVNLLKIWIKLILPKIDKMVDDIINPMHCFVDLPAPHLKGNIFDNTPFECPDSSEECKIKEFFLANQQGLQNILDALHNLPSDKIDKETAAMTSALKKIIKKRLRRSTDKFSNKSQDEKLCWKCGDAIHTVLAPEVSSVINRNERHYKPLCDAVEKQCVSYSSPRVP